MYPAEARYQSMSMKRRSNRSSPWKSYELAGSKNPKNLTPRPEPIRVKANHFQPRQGASEKTYLELAVKGKLTAQQILVAFKQGKLSRESFRKEFIATVNLDQPTRQDLAALDKFNVVLEML